MNGEDFFMAYILNELKFTIFGFIEERDRKKNSKTLYYKYYAVWFV